MRKLAILTFQSLDGVMQAPSSPEEDKSNDFTKGGWANPYWDEVMQQVMKEAMAEPYDLLLGRKTYDIFASHFPNATEENLVAQKLNNASKYVVSSTLDKPLWKNTIYLKGNINEELKKLKEGEGPLLQVHGSWELIQELLKQNLIDEFRVWTFPVVLGKGKRLFSGGHLPLNLKLIKSEKCENGVVMNIYKSKRQVQS
ncbi:dihydrofolate reductase family protein [Flagellimonas meridianipacifica]|uniref:Dihydrofolate reductase n=1 Tax=Flagellimonas meridianipacifica TaxID=1080225 RepID=A0A2T0MIK8_9FLAO|nr:dihydrofolate reductase family protein [Allomuricauda pacifica]PRX57385.1 dihydrofolate reductase [Allomuricauda pacifica]